MTITFSDNFDSGTPGDDIDVYDPNYTYTSTVATAKIANDQSVSSSNSVKFVTTGTVGENNYKHNVNESANTFYYKLRIDDRTLGKSSIQLNGDHLLARQGVVITIQTDGEIEYRTAGGWQPTGVFLSDDTWYTLKITFDVSTKLWSGWIDGGIHSDQAFATNKEFRHSSSWTGENILEFMIRQIQSSIGYTTWVDDIQMGESPVLPNSIVDCSLVNSSLING